MATKVCPVRLPEEQATALKDRHGSVTAGIRAAVNAYLGIAASEKPADPPASPPTLEAKRTTSRRKGVTTPAQSAAREFLADRPRPGKRPLNPRQSGR